MTPEEILTDLRDIHMPDSAADGAGAALVLWPLLLVLLAALILVFLFWRRRSVWRRELLADLDRLKHQTGKLDQRERWARLALLLRRFAIHKAGKRDIARLTGEPWLAKLDQLIGVDIFTKGAGRGLVSFPYGDQTTDEARMADDLDATIATLRRRLSSFGALS